MFQCNWTQIKIAGEQSPSEWVWGGWGICTGAPGFNSSTLDVKSFCAFFTAGQFSLIFSPTPLMYTPLAWGWVCSKYAVKYLVFPLFWRCLVADTHGRVLFALGLYHSFRAPFVVSKNSKLLRQVPVDFEKWKVQCNIYDLFSSKASLLEGGTWPQLSKSHFQGCHQGL